MPFEGQLVDADQLEFETEKEPFSVYKLEDGTIIKLKTVLGNVSRLVDRYKPDGEPIYILAVGGMPVTEVPANLRQQPAQQKTEKG